jgi:hypothetical protein
VSTSFGEIDSLLRDRFHGAANIRGVRWQTLYAVSLALELYNTEDGELRIRLEGLEDVDRLGHRLIRNAEYIQVKSSTNRWTPGRLTHALQSFAAVAKADPLSYFRLVLEGPLNGDLQLLCCAPTNRSQQQKNVALWINVCRDAGLTKEDARSLASRLFLESISEHEIIERLRNHVSRAFEVNSTATELYLAVFVARFLEWAARRGTIDRQSIDSVRVEIGEHIAREQVNQAVGRGLLQRVNWACDGQIDDFYEGKATRPGHIAASVDVLRPSWLTRIKELL